jgi:hypothetical protein
VGIVVKDSLLFQTLKNSRSREVLALNNIEASTTMTDSQKDKAAAEARLSFVRDATRIFKTSRSEGKSTAKTQINAVSAILKDLSTAVSEYNSARNAGETTAAEDTAFSTAVKTLHTSFKGLALTLKGLLRNEGQFYNVNMEQTRKYLDEIQAGLDALDAPPVAPLTVSADSSSGGSLDITV